MKKSSHRQKLETLLKKNPFETLVDAIYTIVLHDIISYKYANGDQIKEAALAEDFGVSRTPVRAVVDRLVEQGFLTKAKNSVALVKTYTPVEREDLVAARLNLEPMAMSYAARRITDSELGVLDEYMKKLSAACLAKDMVSAFECENTLHDYMIRCCHNSFIIKQYDVLKHYFYQSRMFFTANNGFYEYYIQEHQLLVSVIKLRDADLAEAAMIRHLSVIKSADQPINSTNPKTFNQSLGELMQK